MVQKYIYHFYPVLSMFDMVLSDFYLVLSMQCIKWYKIYHEFFYPCNFSMQMIMVQKSQNIFLYIEMYVSTG